jgi:hypothetical protein
MPADARRHYARRTAPEIDNEITHKSILCLPIGSIEQHGTHLPLNTDTVIAEKFAATLAEHTLGIAACAVHPFSLSTVPVGGVVPDIHAGVGETSLMLALAPDDVRPDQLPGDGAVAPGQAEAIGRRIRRPGRHLTVVIRTAGPRHRRRHRRLLRRQRRPGPRHPAQRPETGLGRARPTRPVPIASPSTAGGPMQPTDTEKAEFKRDGLIIRRGIVGPDLTAPATALIDEWYREQMNPDRIADHTQRTFAPHLGNHPALLNLLTASGAIQLATGLLGQISPVTTAQIQIRIPGRDLPGAQPAKAMHVDGVSCPHLDPDELRTFSLLVGIPLSDINDPRGGALHFQRGGHLSMSQWFATQWSLGITEQVPPDIDATTGTPFLGAAGDVLLMHHLVPHAVGRNDTTTPRVIAYFRLSHPDHPGRRLDAIRNPWLDFPPLAGIDALDLNR